MTKTMTIAMMAALAFAPAAAAEKDVAMFGNTPSRNMVSEEKGLPTKFDLDGGKNIKCWIAGEKRLLVAMGVFRTAKTFLQFRLTDACSRAIEKVLDRDADVLTPWKESARG